MKMLALLCAALICTPITTHAEDTMFDGDLEAIIRNTEAPEVTHNTTARAPLPAEPIPRVEKPFVPANDLCTSTTFLPAGEVDRLVAGPDGTLKLKRFMITSKCVNGHLQSTAKRLN